MNNQIELLHEDLIDDACFEGPMVDAPIGVLRALTEDQPQAQSRSDFEDSYILIAKQRVEWQRRALLRIVYRDCFQRMIDVMARDASGSLGLSIELGCGGAFFKDDCPEVVSTDIIESPWADCVLNAEQLPFEDGSVRNVVMFDVLHHLSDAGSCFRELMRVLEPGGRVVMCEPYISPFSWCIYKAFHREPVDFSIDPLRAGSAVGDEPMEGNGSIPTKIFFTEEGLRSFSEQCPAMAVVRKQRLSLLVYPLSGGFSGPVLFPSALGKLGLAVERLLQPVLGALMAFRCLVVLERD